MLRRKFLTYCDAYMACLVSIQNFHYIHGLFSVDPKFSMIAGFCWFLWVIWAQASVYLHSTKYAASESMQAALTILPGECKILGQLDVNKTESFLGEYEIPLFGGVSVHFEKPISILGQQVEKDVWHIPIANLLSAAKVCPTWSTTPLQQIQRSFSERKEEV